MAFGSSGSGDGQLHNPAAAAVDSGGNIYVVDSGNHRIQKFDSQGAYVAQWGSQGSGNGQFESPAHIAIDGTTVRDRGQVYIIHFSMGDAAGTGFRKPAARGYGGGGWMDEWMDGGKGRRLRGGSSVKGRVSRVEWKRGGGRAT